MSVLSRSPLFVITALVAAGPAALAAQRPDSAAFVTRLGDDTLAIERFVRTGRWVDADVVLRVPTTLRTRYRLELAPNGELARLEATTADPRAGSGTPVRREVITRAGDSLRIETTTDGPARTRTVAAPGATLPFIDMVHWPYEIALVRAKGAGGLTRTQPLLTGGRVSEFALAAVGADSVTITHPFRGTMRARVDAMGRLLGLDAAGTTRKLVLERRPWMDVDALVSRWAELDASGRSLGALSGRGGDTVRVGAATLSVDFGRPAKRGREIWGELVPFGQVWRTGANQATHLATDRDLVLGAGADTLVVPAGRYTLFSIPDAAGGVLIVNRQTGQNGTAYDPARDLGRVRLTSRTLDESVELFTIRIEPATGARGELKVIWDRREMAVGVRVR